MSDARDELDAPPSAPIDTAAPPARAPEETVAAEGASGAGSFQDRPTPREPLPTPSPSPVPPPVEPPSPDVALADDASPLPGAHRGGFSRLPTGPVGVTSLTAPAEPGTETHQTVLWLPREPSTAHGWLAAWALAFSIAGLVVSLFVGWGFPIGLVGVVAALVALRRPLESRGTAVWALCLGLGSVLYSAGWLLWAASRTNLG